ncbi:MAG TPA: alpha/beta hydrolase-fold protein [Candidatus Krumholzibacterium sp.]|nr:alpha/beta hydrolase-fold protein [Candidatus Krumholzibacterium sp.]
MTIMLAAVLFFPAGDSPASEPTLEWPDLTLHVEARKFLPCGIYLPDDFSEDTEYPLIIGLHGFGSSPDRFAAILDYLPSRSFILAVPEPPYPYVYEGTRTADRFSWDYQGDASLWAEADPMVCRYIADVADSLRARFRVSKTVIMGFSQGAAYAYSTAIKYAEDIYGIMAFSGLFPEPGRYPWMMDARSLEKSSSTRVFIAHGSRDSAIGQDLSLKASKVLEASGYDVELMVFDGGHMIPPGALVAGLRWLGIGTE